MSDYVIVSLKYTNGQDFACFWREKAMGYTWRIDVAGRWTKEEAERQAHRSHGDSVPMLYDDVLKGEVRVVSADHVFALQRAAHQPHLDSAPPKEEPSK